MALQNDSSFGLPSLSIGGGLKDPLAGPGLHPSDRVFGQFSTGGNLHDTFRVDRYNNIYGGHTTVDLGNNLKIRMPWDR